MGMYNNSVKEVVEAIAQALDDIEGDFDYKTLIEACDRCKSYPYTAEKASKKKIREWENYLI